MTSRTNEQRRVMMLIDADNVSADVLDQAVERVMAQHGAIHVRRAYCTAESALANLQLFKRHSIRPIVNLSTGKNSTDISLAVDAIDLVMAERPDIVVIVSSDSDFAPLVIRLREKGCRVEGIGQQGKTGEDSKPVYDDFIDLTHHKARVGEGLRAAPRKRAAPRRAADAGDAGVSEGAGARAGARAGATSGRRSAAASPAVALPSASAPVDAPPPASARRATAVQRIEERVEERNGRAERTERFERPRRGGSVAPEERPEPSEPRAALPTEARRPRSRTRAPAVEQAVSAAVTTAAAVTHAEPPLPDDVLRILAAVPELTRGDKLELGIAAEQLRAGQLLARSATSTKLFKKFPDHFALTPERQPNKVQYVGPRLA